MNYIFSTERSIKGLPAAGHIVRPAKCLQRDDAVFFELNRPLTKKGPKTFLLVPKVAGHTFFDDRDAVFAYVLDASNLINAEPIDLSQLRENVLDWGGLAKTHEAAAQWQVSEEAQVASQRDLEKFFKGR
jgi:hypothetical protein